MTSWTVAWILTEASLTYSGTWKQECTTTTVVYKIRTKYMGSKF